MKLFTPHFLLKEITKYKVGKIGRFLIDGQIYASEIFYSEELGMYIHKDRADQSWIIWTKKGGIWKDHTFLGYHQKVFEI